MEGLDRLESLSLTCLTLTDADLSHVKRLTRLRFLCISKASPYITRDAGNSLTDAGLAALEPLRELEALSVDGYGTRITTAGLVHLGRLTRLRSVRLGESRVDSLDPLIPLAGLEHLDLSGSKVDDAGLAAIGSLPRLKDLELMETPVTDAGLASLRDCANLKEISLDGTRVGNEGLIMLARKMPSLESIGVRRTLVTPEGVKAAEAVRPGLAIFEE